MHYRVINTAFGFIGIIFKDDKAKRILLPKDKATVLREISSEYPTATEVRNGMDDLATMIAAYLTGEDIVVPMEYVDTQLVTPFQLRVLLAERSIPRGMTASYSWLARTAGTKAIRAAGSALARNPWPIVVPCHRAVRMDRSIGQYQGGSEMKRQLLIMEGVSFESSGRVARDCFLK